MFCVAVCDDEKTVCQQIKSFLEPYCKKGEFEVHIFTSGEALYEAVSAGTRFDLIFLDIELKLMSGVAVGQKIREELCDEEVHIVFISGKTEYAMELFAIRPLHFLTKPFTRKQIIEVLEKAMRLSIHYQDTFEFKIDQTYHKIRYGEIWYFESKARKISLHTENEEYLFYGKLNQVEDATGHHFLRIHQSYLVNPQFIACYEYHQVHLLNSRTLPISESCRKQVKQQLLQKWSDL